MKVVINNVEYTKITNLAFAPQTNLLGTDVPINEFSVDIYTTDTIRAGNLAYLYDDGSNVWAKYWIVSALQVQANIVTVQARSALMLLERVTLEPVMYSAEPVTNILDDIFDVIVDTFGANAYNIDATLSATTITGFCPEQTAKERLQWVCFVIGGYINTSFTDTVNIEVLDTTTYTRIPDNKVYWKPSTAYSDYVSAVKIRAFTYTLGTPATTDEWVQVGNDYYIQTYRDFTLSNPVLPVTAAENIVTIDSVTIINENNVNTLLNFISMYYFNNLVITADLLNVGEFLNGRGFELYDGTQLLKGLIETMSFTFGKLAKSTITMAQCEEIPTGTLTVECFYNNRLIHTFEYRFPVGYTYSVENQYIDTQIMYTRYIYYPETQYVTGVIPSGGVTVSVNYDIALYQNEKAVLQILNVDEADFNDGELEIE